MILAQNRQQLLNGNNIKLFCLLLLSSLVLFSCGTTKTASNSNQSSSQGKLPKKRYNPETGQYETVTDIDEKAEVIRYKNEGQVFENSSTNTIPSENTSTSTNTGTFGNNIAILLPFNGQEFNTNSNSIPRKAQLALTYYAGAKMALEELSNQGYTANVEILDSKTNTSEQFYNGLTKYDLLIGGVGTRTINSIYNKPNVYISTINPAISLSNLGNTDNKVIQLNPSFDSHCLAIIKEARKTFSPEDIIVVVKNKSSEVKRIQNFRRANQSIPGTTGRIQELIVNFPGEINIAELIRQNSSKCFIVPSWSDVDFLEEVMRVVRIEKNAKNAKIVLFGMPQWLEMEKLTFDNFTDLNLHLSAEYFLDLYNPSVQSFRQNYFHKYGTEPNKYALKGYDLTYQVVKNYLDTPNNFTKKLTHLPLMDIDINLQNEGDTRNGSNFMENKKVHILKYMDYKFQPIR